ncbi:major facilitator superfamily transporter [Biscogniauxia sp. FL1348]|nr:major facilitator superfamily transporter [Biscogniauxia sp. FL1348]
MAAVSDQVTAIAQEQDSEKISGADNGVQDIDDDTKDKSDSSSEHKQDGVKQVEAITTVWSKELMIVMFILLYLVSFVDSLLQSVQQNLIPFVTSSFGRHGLLSTTSIVATIIGGVCNLAIAKVIDIWGRCEGFIVMVTLVVVGMIMKATCINVEMYAAAHTLYWVGHIGMQYIIDIILADTTTLKNRLILFGIKATPTIAVTFAGPRIADLFYTNVNFRWAFGAFSIILVFFSIPVAVIFIISKRKAVKAGVFPKRVSNRTTLESVKYYLIQFDAVGMFLTVFGWSLLLLPFSLVTYAPNGWKTGYIIALIIVGFLLLAAFPIWEKYYAPVQYFPFKFLMDRTILGSCLLYCFTFLSIYCWDAYYSSYLQVVHGLTITTSGYVLNTLGLTAAFIGPFLGLLVRYTGAVKWPAIAGIPFAVLGTALLIHFRQPSSHVGLLVMCQIFNGISSEIWSLGSKLAVMASVDHQQIAVVVALHSLFASIGAAIGFAIAGGIWTNILPAKLYENLPEGSKNLTSSIYGSLVIQESYPLGSPIRDAIIASYADVQRKMVIAGTAFLPLCIISIFMWKNINVLKIEETKGKQTKGNVW